MNERQLTVCAIALFCDGWSFEQIGQALGVSRDRASELAGNGGDQMASGTKGHMASTMHEGHVVAVRGDDGTIIETAKED